MFECSYYLYWILWFHKKKKRKIKEDRGKNEIKI